MAERPTSRTIRIFGRANKQIGSTSSVRSANLIKLSLLHWCLSVLERPGAISGEVRPKKQPMKAISPILSVLPGYGIRVLIAYILERHASYICVGPVLLPAYESSPGFISSLYTRFRVFASLNLYLYHFVGGSRIQVLLEAISSDGATGSFVRPAQN
jgi:hypothetical protein